MQKAQRNRSKTIKITVTRADIRKAEEASRRCEPMSYYCPIGQALHKHKGLHDAAVALYEIEYGHNQVAALPKKASVFVARFDSGKPVKPFSFLLKLP